MCIRIGVLLVRWFAYLNRVATPWAVHRPVIAAEGRGHASRGHAEWLDGYRAQEQNRGNEENGALDQSAAVRDGNRDSWRRRLLNDRLFRQDARAVDDGNGRRSSVFRDMRHEIRDRRRNLVSYLESRISCLFGH